VIATTDIFLFEDFRLDRQGTGLSRRDESGVFSPLSIGARTLDVLAVLVERPGDLVTKEEIMAAVWRRSVVENANLTVQIAALRRVLDKGRLEGSCIQTVAARGYRFLPAVTRVAHADERSEAIASLETRNGAPAHNPPAIDAAEYWRQTVGLPLSRSRRRRPALFAFAMAMAALILVGAPLLWMRLGSPPAPSTENASLPPRSSAPRLSIVVLPFINLSNDPHQQYFADGITDDLTTDLSRLTGMFVIARNTAFTYKDKPIDAKQIGRELGVRYVLEGSARRSGNQVRVNTQLVDADSGAHLWAERFDREAADLLAVQNEITNRIAATLHLALIGAEAARPIERSDATDYILRGRAAFYRSPTRDNYAEAVAWFERALSVDPASAEAKSLLASILAERALARMTDTSADDFARAETLVRQVLAVSPRSPIAHYAYGQVLRATRRNEQCIGEYQEALAFNPGWADALAGLGWCKFWVGSLDEAIELQEQAIRLSPRDPQIGYWYHRIGMVYLLQSRIAEAIPRLEKGRATIPTFPLAYSFLGAAYALNGEPERGAKELAETYRLSGKVWVSTIADMKVTGYWARQRSVSSTNRFISPAFASSACRRSNGRREACSPPRTSSSSRNFASIGRARACRGATSAACSSRCRSGCGLSMSWAC
jgi:TolB-like protein/DNA-binding winged helix-turn-helix (wHTH) protein/cytochrome c-type biogenesis protein CcmH/NrfG